MHILINETMVIILRCSNMLTFLFFIFQIFPKSGNKTDVNRQLSGNVVDRFFHVIISVWQCLKIKFTWSFSLLISKEKTIIIHSSFTALQYFLLVHFSIFQPIFLFGLNQDFTAILLTFHQSYCQFSQIVYTVIIISSFFPCDL
jgi:hypothetical protein